MFDILATRCGCPAGRGPNASFSAHTQWELFIYRTQIIRIYGQEGMCVN